MLSSTARPGEDVERPNRQRASLRLAASAGVAVLAIGLASCATTAPGGTATDGPVEIGDCGTVAALPPVDDPDGIVPTLSPDLQSAFNGFPSPILASAWADTKPKGEPPYKVGLSFLPVANAWATTTVEVFQDLFDEAKAAGLVEGELDIQMPADATTMTAADQIAGYQKLVDDGADIILMYPLDGDAMAAPVTAAGEQGIPTVTLVGNVPSPYAVNVGNNPYNRVSLPFAEGMKLLGGQGNLIIVSGIEGISITTISVDAVETALASCPNINVVGTVNGDYSNSVTKSALITFLASHPEPIDAVVQIGTMGAGVWSAFEDTGRPFPLIIDIGGTAGSFGYWDREMKDNGYVGVGLAETAEQGSDTVWDVAMRVLEGQGPITNQIPVVPTVITNDNLGKYVVEGAPLSSEGDTLSGGDWIPKDLLDQMFHNP